MKLSEINNTTLSRLFTTAEPVLFRGAPGIAKTAKVQQFAEQAGLGCVVEFLPAIDAPDAMGFLVPTKTPDGTPVSRYAKPSWLAKIEATGKSEGILLLDEFLAADHLVQKAFAPLLSERAIGEWRLPEGWVVWMTGNRQQDRAGANSMLSHISNRLFLIDVEPEVTPWVHDFAVPHGMHPMYVAFAQSRPEVVFSGEAPKDPNAPYCTPRSLTKAHAFHAAGVEGDQPLPTDEVTQGIVAAAIGPGAAAELFGFLKTHEFLPSKEDILRDPEGCKVPPEDRLDAQYAAMQMVVYYADAQNIDAMVTYMMRLVRELQVSCASQLVRKCAGAALNSPKLGEFISKNAALLTDVMSN